MLGDAVANAIVPGSGLAMLGARSFGDASQRARLNGASINEQFGYGIGNAATEMLTEKMFDGLAGVYGKGVADDIAKPVVNKFGKTEGGRAALKAISSMGGEAIEEVVSGAIEPALGSIYNGKAVRDNYSRDTAADIAHNALVGGVLGGIGGAVDARVRPIGMKDFANTKSSVWNNVKYGDIDTQRRIMQAKHREMVNGGKIVRVPETALNEVAQAYPDLRGMKKSERTPILKQKIGELKAALRNTLNGLKGAYEFEVNGNILEARLYDTGAAEVMERMTQQKAGMLTQSAQIFQNAQYLYSTPDYEGNPNIYRWNYFYTPVQIGDQTVGVRIAIRDMVPSASGIMDSQIYHWGIKENASLDDGRPGERPNTTGVSLDALSKATIPQVTNVVNPVSYAALLL